MTERKLKQMSVRIDPKLLKRLSTTLGVDDSKAIRAAMNCADNIIHRLFGGEVSNIFRRRKTDEEVAYYDTRI